MAKRTSTSIAKKAHARAEADFATWLMMAKLGSFDDLPPDAQKWLTGYRTRLQEMREADAVSATIREIYVAYYAEMGGAGEAPDLGRSASRTEDKVVDRKPVPPPGPAMVSRAAASPPPARSRRSWSPLFIFAGMVAAFAVFKFAFGF
jgi:hypothetical protein